ncbi:MAG: CHAD domain-containing protein [Rhizobiaceae bacterium]
MSARLAPGEPLEAAARRLLAEEIAPIGEALDLARTEPSEGVHEARRRFKRIRAVLGLLRAANEDFFIVENARYRDLSRTLAPAREAAALVETLDRLAEDEPEAAEALSGLREQLTARRPKGGDARLVVALDNARAWCDAGAVAASRFSPALDAPGDADVVAAGVARPLRRASRALARLRRHATAEDFHDMRKAVKAHAAHVSVLADLWPGGAKERRKHAGRLSDRLGELNDVHVLRHLVMTRSEPPGGLAGAAWLTKLLARAEKANAREALAIARKLFDQKPRIVGASLADAVRAASRRADEADRLANRLAALA